MAMTQFKQASTKSSLNYESVGVSTDKAEDGLKRLTRHIKSTWPSEKGTGSVRLPLGQFANVIDIAGQGIAFCTDGVGSKALIAQMFNKYDTIGIDCVAMNVNDLICVGATPISLVDYIAVETANPSMLEEISIGLTDGAGQANISISGGEIAQLPGMIHGAVESHGFDLVGAAIGHVDLDKILSGKSIEPGDAIIGVASNGIHSNGLTLARKAFFDHSQKFSLNTKFDELGCTLGEELLKPTHIYVRESLEILEKVPNVKALVHITSNGLLNLARMEADVQYVIKELMPIPPIFSLIQKHGEVSNKEMFHVYNMGVGFCYVVKETSVEETLNILRAHGRQAAKIGDIEANESGKKSVKIVEKGLRGRGRNFEEY